MRKSLLASVFTVCIGLVGTTGWVLCNPTSVVAATGTADCGNGLQATCAAFSCVCIDGKGCTGLDANDHVLFTNTCIGKRLEQIIDAQSGIVTE